MDPRKRKRAEAREIERDVAAEFAEWADWFASDEGQAWVDGLWPENWPPE